MSDEWCSKARQQQEQRLHGIPWSNYLDNYTVFAGLKYARIVTPSARAKSRFEIHDDPAIMDRWIPCWLPS
jgi:hypothetical protein